MSRTVISVVGTSLLDRLATREIKNWNTGEKGIENKMFRKDMEDRSLERSQRSLFLNREEERIKEIAGGYLANLDSRIYKMGKIITGEEAVKLDDFFMLPGEIASFMCFQKQYGDEGEASVLLLTPDAPENWFCGEIIKRILEETSLCSRAGVKNVTGLQLEDTGAFFNYGRFELIEVIYAYMGKEAFSLTRREHGKYLDITGSCKGFVPYLTQVANFFNMPVFYWHEPGVKVVLMQPTPFISQDKYNDLYNFLNNPDENRYTLPGNLESQKARLKSLLKEDSWELSESGKYLKYLMHIWNDMFYLHDYIVKEMVKVSLLLLWTKYKFTLPEKLEGRGALFHNLFEESNSELSGAGEFLKYLMDIWNESN